MAEGTHASHLAQSILLVIGVSIVIVALFQRLRLPSVAGFILTGALIGPYGLGWAGEAEAIKLLAELGVALLLFSLGVEFSIDKLIQLRHYVLRAGIAQVGLTTLFSALGAGLLGFNFAQSIALGMIISLSSTAVGVKILKQREELDSTHGRFAVGVLLFQDIMAPIFMAVLPFLTQLQERGAAAVATKLVFTVIGGVGVYLAARVIVPTLLRWITSTESREIPVLGSLFIALLMSYITQSLGLSSALGAFVAGVIISETPYSHQITANITPFRDSFLAVFFISVGMLVDLPYLKQTWVQTVLWTVGLMAFKCLLVLGVALVIRRPLRVGLLAGLVLANIGEFSFVLMEQSQANQLLPTDLLNGLIAGTSLSILLTPLLLAATYQLLARATKRAHWLAQMRGKHETHPQLRDHIIIVGFGLNGRNLASILRELDEPFVVVEMNGALVREAQKQGIPVVYGDAAHPEIMQAAGIERARAVVIAVSDPISARYTVRTIRELNPDVYVIVRTRYMSEIEPLYAAGATDVVPEEFETFIEIAGRVMRLLGVDNEQRLRLMNQCRARHYQMLQDTKEGMLAN
ncbi:MAG: potassium transporter KefB [Armatimonadetes bacterium JP3_11]|nr:MAG: potassium transporter KefB [Armatimonadetes bacterium JP3_11]RMH06307.1 MAG: potassium transporter KefB [Armatimonadota bacterium]